MIGLGSDKNDVFMKNDVIMKMLLVFLWYKRSWNYGLGTPAQETQMMYFVSILLCIKRDSTELLTCREVTAQRAGVGLERSKQRIFVPGGNQNLLKLINVKCLRLLCFHVFQGLVMSLRFPHVSHISLISRKIQAYPSHQRLFSKTRVSS